MLAVAVPCALAEKDDGFGATVSSELAIAIMLMGTVTFMMSLFYVTNAYDEDFRFYSWDVISSTISIFSAVLLFQAFKGVSEWVVLGLATGEIGESGEGHAEMEAEEEEVMSAQGLLFGFAMLVVWYVTLQVTFAWITGAIGNVKEVREKEDISSSFVSKKAKARKAQENRKTALQIDLKFWGTLLGHITAFSAIFAFGAMQQALCAKEGIIFVKGLKCAGAFTCAVLAFVFLAVVNRLTSNVRIHISHAGDNRCNEDEKMWMETTQEVENDVVALCVSFLVIQSCVFAVTGVLPDIEGEVKGRHGFKEAVQLFIVGVLLMGCLFLKTQTVSDADDASKRRNTQAGFIVAMCFAWCVYFAASWTTASAIPANGMLREVTVALVISGFGLALIFVADKVADHDRTSPETDDVIRNDVVAALGFLIGFSWEKSFDKAVTHVADSMGHTAGAQVMLKLVLAAIVVGLTLPAWFRFILPQHLRESERQKQRTLLQKLNYMVSRSANLHVPAENDHKYRERTSDVRSMRAEPTLEYLIEESSDLSCLRHAVRWDEEDKAYVLLHDRDQREKLKGHRKKETEKMLETKQQDIESIKKEIEDCENDFKQGQISHLQHMNHQLESHISSFTAEISELKSIADGLHDLYHLHHRH